MGAAGTAGKVRTSNSEVRMICNSLFGRPSPSSCKRSKPFTSTSDGGIVVGAAKNAMCPRRQHCRVPRYRRLHKWPRPLQLPLQEGAAPHEVFHITRLNALHTEVVKALGRIYHARHLACPPRWTGSGTDYSRWDAAGRARREVATVKCPTMRCHAASLRTSIRRGRWTSNG